MAEEDNDGEPNERRYCTLSPITVRRLGVLAKRGTHGTSVPKVMATMIEQGIREAIEKGYIALEDGETP